MDSEIFFSSIINNNKQKDGGSVDVFNMTNGNPNQTNDMQHSIYYDVNNVNSFDQWGVELGKVLA